MLQWMFYAVVVAGLFSISGWLTEQALRQRRVLQTRWVWVVAMGLTVLVACAAFPRPPTPQAQPQPVVQQTWRAIHRFAPVKLPQLVPPVTTGADYLHIARWNATIVALWVLMSTALALAITTSGIRVYRHRRGWPMRMLDAHCVGVAPSTGPAVVGLLRPTIVIPRWVLDREPSEQQLIVAHEVSHLRARDPAVLTAALAALILMPWNIPLWWQLLRLRHSIEVDCDARVLGAGHDTRAYGEALIEVGQRRSGFVGIVAAMSESRTLLEQRIEIMTQRDLKPWTYGFVVLCALALTIAVAATQVTAPDTSGSRREISVDAATLDRYVGKYHVGSTNILTVTREGAQLEAQITGQPKLPLFAETPIEFFWKVVDAQVTFATGDSGPATSATIHQYGRDIVSPRLDDTSAEALEQQLKDRVSRQQPLPASEALLRKSIAALAAGAPNYQDMTPLLQDLTRRQLPALESYLKDWGTMRSVEFRGVAEMGADKYLVTHQSGKQSQWLINLDSEGKISAMAVLPVF